MKKAFRLIMTILVVSVIVITFNFLIEGVPLFGIPNAENVEKVIITNADYPNEVKEYIEEDKIKLAVALLGYLRYTPLKGLTDDNQLIKISYIMDDGEEYVVSANNYTVWWNGKPSAIKDENKFIKICNGVFFSEN